MQRIAVLVCLLLSLVLFLHGQVPTPAKPGAAQAPSATAKPNAAQTPTAKAGVPVKQNPMAPYAGNWVGTFEGKPWMVLKLVLTETSFSGLLQHPQKLDFADNGELKKISEEFVSEPVTDAVVNPDGLLLTFKEPEKQESSRYMMKLTSETTAEIKMLAMTMPPGMPKPKPWKLTKTAGSPLAKPADAPQKH